MNKIRLVTSSVLVLAVVGVLQASGGSSSAPSKEYQVKAAFIYNFLKFIDWPEKSGQDAGRNEDSGRPTVIGIIGHNPFGKAFEAVADKKAQSKEVEVRYLAGFAENSVRSRDEDQTPKYRDEDALKACHVLFVSASEKNYYKEIISIVKDDSVLTIGETEGFLEQGGVIEFVVEEKKVRFGINLITAERVGLKIRSKLLRLAKRVIQQGDEEANS